MSKKKMAKFTLSNGTVIFLEYTLERKGKTLHELRDLIEKLSGKKVEDIETKEIEKFCLTTTEKLSHNISEVKRYG